MLNSATTYPEVTLPLLDKAAPTSYRAFRALGGELWLRRLAACRCESGAERRLGMALAIAG